MALTPFAYTLASTSLRNQKAGFELQFNLLQNSLIRRFNEKVEKVSETPITVRNKIEDLSARQQKLLDSLPAIQEFRQGSLNTAGTLEIIFDDITALFETFNQDATVDAAEIEAFEKQRDLVADKINNLYDFSHPDIFDGNTVDNLKDDIETLRSLTLTAGPLTDNSDVTDTLSALQNEVSVGITVIRLNASTALDLEQQVQARFTTAEAELYELTTLEQERRDEEISEAETKLGNLLRAISLSFETNSGLSEALASRLRPMVPPPGSAVNIIS